MIYGFDIRRPDGKAAITDYEMQYHYWGRIEFTNEHTGGRNDRIYELFGIPAAWNPRFFVTCSNTDIDQDNYERIDASGFIYGIWDGIMKVRTRFWDTSRSRTYRIYVFVPCCYTTPPSYGIELYNRSGVANYHAGRPAMTIKQIVRSYSDAPFSHADNVHVNSNYACSSLQTYGGNALKVGWGDNALHGAGVTSLDTRNGRITSMPYYFNFGDVIPGWLQRIGSAASSTALIDRTYYDQFSNLRATRFAEHPILGYIEHDFDLSDWLRNTQKLFSLRF